MPWQKSWTSRYTNCADIAHFTDVPCQNQVSFVVNAPYPDMLGWLSHSSIGLSTMVDEHFGINVVEFMVSSASPCVNRVELVRVLTACFSW